MYGRSASYRRRYHADVGRVLTVRTGSYKGKFNWDLAGSLDSARSVCRNMSTAMLGERAPAWELNEAGRQVGVLAGPEYSGQAGQDPREDWNWTQNEGQQVDNNLLEDNLMNEIESARRMEECRSWSYGAPWSKPPNSTFREPEYRDHDNCCDKWLKTSFYHILHPTG